MGSVGSRRCSATSLTLEVVAHAKGTPVTPEHLHAISFAVPGGTTFAVVMRRAGDSGLDAYVRLDEGSEVNPVVVSDFEQSLLPMGHRLDGVVVWRAPHDEPLTQYLVIAGDRELSVDATFQLDLVDLGDSALPAGINEVTVGRGAYVDSLRDLEPAVADFIARGALEEGPDGVLVAHPKGLPLAERAELNQVEGRGNALRTEFFGLWPAPSDAGATLGALWAAIR